MARKTARKTRPAAKPAIERTFAAFSLRDHVKKIERRAAHDHALREREVAALESIAKSLAVMASPVGGR